MDPMEALPDNALANILCRLPACDVAASRCVRKGWCTVIDAHWLSLPHILPHTVRGLFVNYIDYNRPCFFARPSTELPAINGDLGFLPGYNKDFQPIVDHCNGLLIYGSDHREFCVVNPARRRWERLPRLDARYYNTYLMFDPAVSPHYEVFTIPVMPEKIIPVKKPSQSKKLSQFSGPYCLNELFFLLEDTPAVKDFEEECEDGPSELPSVETIEEDDLPVIFAPSPIECRGNQEDPGDLVEWPPSSWMLDVFSSSTKQWQKRSFVREGDALETVATMRLDRFKATNSGPRWRYGVYWGGALYVHCRGAFVVRLLLQDGKYQLVKTPIDIEESQRAEPCLGKSEKGVYFAAIHDHSQLRVWILSESSGQISWELKHHIDLNPRVTTCSNQPKGINKTWFLYGDNDEDGTNKKLGGQNFEWNSDDDSILNIDDDYDFSYRRVSILGFHPYKEIVFLEVSSFKGVAYHLNSSKVQYLGELRPKDYYKGHSNGIYESFPYTPCMVGELSECA